MKRAKQAFEKLLIIMDELREKCPWDRQQSMESLRHLTIEETYELSEAISDRDMANIKKELGDLMLHIVFYSKIASEEKQFGIAEVIEGLCEKLIHRHPHVFGQVRAETAEQVKQNWEQLKLKEDRSSILQGVPRALPSLIKAQRIQEKVKAVGFDWEDTAGPLEKIHEEALELKEAFGKGGSPEQIEDEYGDLLFSLINFARFIKVNPDAALEKTNRKFIHRFMFIEKEAARQNKDLANMELDEMEALWRHAKEEERKKKAP